MFFEVQVGLLSLDAIKPRHPTLRGGRHLSARSTSVAIDLNSATVATTQTQYVALQIHNGIIIVSTANTITIAVSYSA